MCNAEIICLHGRRASSGVAKGRVLIIESYDDLEKVENGSIIVASQTDINFAPYLKRCAGLITETGGRFCHAAIFARENGIPCLTGVSDVMDFLNNGDFVELNADDSKVTVNSTRSY